MAQPNRKWNSRGRLVASEDLPDYSKMTAAQVSEHIGFEVQTDADGNVVFKNDGTPSKRRGSAKGTNRETRLSVEQRLTGLNLVKAGMEFLTKGDPNHPGRIFILGAGDDGRYAPVYPDSLSPREVAIGITFAEKMAGIETEEGEEENED